MQITHENHFVSRSYLNRWANDSGQIWLYRLLVSHKLVPSWSQKAVRGVAYKRDLYTSRDGGVDTDDTEKWLESEIETPAAPAIERAISGQELSLDDWDRLAYFAAAQDLRTPQDYIESMRRWESELPNLLQETLNEGVRKLEYSAETGESITSTASSEDSPFHDLIKVHMAAEDEENSEQQTIRAEVLAGRKLWLARQRHLLTTKAKVFTSHSWCIAEAYEGMEWFTSDHPVVRLNYYGKGRLDIRGGWGRDGGNICMPLSPRYLLLTQIGVDVPKRLILTESQTIEISKAIAARAHRTIFAKEPIFWVEQVRPRVVDAELNKQENEAWESWHGVQTNAQQEFDSDN